MPRIQRLHRVRATYRNGEQATRHYQTPEAAEERRIRFAQGRPQVLSADALERHKTEHPGEPVPLDVPSIEVTASHPVTYPHAAGDPARFDVPDAELSRAALDSFLIECGVLPHAVTSLTFDGSGILIEYSTDPRRAPNPWHVNITEE